MLYVVYDAPTKKSVHFTKSLKVAEAMCKKNPRFKIKRKFNDKN